jgi:hypothetical protein
MHTMRARHEVFRAAYTLSCRSRLTLLQRPKLAFIAVYDGTNRRCGVYADSNSSYGRGAGPNRL